jgi:hypothetical protein
MRTAVKNNPQVLELDLFYTGSLFYLTPAVCYLPPLHRRASGLLAEWLCQHGKLSISVLSFCQPQALLSVLHPVGFPTHTKNLFTFLFSIMRATCLTHFILDNIEMRKYGVLSRPCEYIFCTLTPNICGSSVWHLKSYAERVRKQG